jgi:hypothetical protein
VVQAALDACLTIEADTMLMECGGDIPGANVPVFLQALGRRDPDVKIIRAASGSLAAIGSGSVLAGMGLVPSLMTGPCTDTPASQHRTQDLRGFPALDPTCAATCRPCSDPGPAWRRNP